LKWSLREAFKKILPNKITDRPKHGFNIPIDKWLKDEWSDMVDEAFSVDSALSRENIIDKKSHRFAKELLSNKERLNGHTVFTFILMNKFLETFCEN